MRRKKKMVKTHAMICPICGNENTVEDSSGFEDMCAYTRNHCEICGAEWEENYSVEYCGYNIADENGQTVIFDAQGEEI
jgi:transcriptional regulator NrdR family protein